MSRPRSKRRRVVHFLFKKEEHPYCGKRKNKGTLATRDEEQATCLSCIKSMKNHIPGFRQKYQQRKASNVA